MKQQNSMQKVVFFTFSDFISGSSGDAINDKKLFEAIPSNYNKIAIYPELKSNKKLPIKSIIKFLGNYFKEIIASNNIIITRGEKLAILPILLNRFFKNKIILRLGCTPLMFVERKAFSENLCFKMGIYTFFQIRI
ncbi:MAG: hypothetical protein ACTSQJ_19935 [Promethearchaeota archaeon]